MINSKVLKSNFLFQNVSEKTMKEIASKLSEPVRLKKHERVYATNRYTHALGIVLKGELRVYRVGADGKRQMCNRLLEGDAFGAATLFYSGELVSDIEAYKETNVLFIPEEQLTLLCTTCPAIALSYIHFLTDRIRFLNHTINDSRGGEAEDKLRMFLLQNADENGCVQLPCSLSGLASILDIGRSSLYRSLDKMERRGELTREGKCLHINRSDLI